jgi:hypothetical protein
VAGGQGGLDVLGDRWSLLGVDYEHRQPPAVAAPLVGQGVKQQAHQHQ